MGLHDRLTKTGNGSQAEATVTRIESAARDAQPESRSIDPYAELKTRIHHACIAKLGPELFTKETTEDLSERVLRAVTEQLMLDRTPLEVSIKCEPRCPFSCAPATARSGPAITSTSATGTRSRSTAACPTSSCAI